MLVLLDRDGVLNEDLPRSVTRPDELHLLPGAASAVARLCRAGYTLVVVTNQSAIEKGYVSAEGVDAIHRLLNERLRAEGGEIARFYICPDHPDRPTARRKPAPGMLLEALADFDADPTRTPLVGDALRDLQAAAAAGCPYYLVRTGQGETTLANGLPEGIAPLLVAADLAAATADILQRFPSS